MEPSLARAVDVAKIKPGEDIDEWLDAVKVVDDKQQFDRVQQKAYAEEAAKASLKRNANAAGLAEPSRRYNIGRNNSNTSKFAFRSNLQGDTSNLRCELPQLHHLHVKEDISR